MQKYVGDIVCVPKRATNLASTITKLVLNGMFDILLLLLLHLPGRLTSFNSEDSSEYINKKYKSK